MQTIPTTKRIEQIFSDEYVREQSFALWEAHLAWMHQLGFERALDRDEGPIKHPGATNHEVVDLLFDFVVSTGLINAHLGLTSSDVIDNVRLAQVSASLHMLTISLDEFCSEFGAMFDTEVQTVGFTHWQPAAPVTWSGRARSWLEPLQVLFDSAPYVHAKRFGGPVGDASSLRLILGDDKVKDHPFEWMHFGLEQPRVEHPIQSSDYLSEQEAVNWCGLVAAKLHKIALDLRFLASRGTIRVVRTPGLAGSSSMPHKTNPFKFEKVCSICRSVATTQHELWDVAANNSLERTLDGSWQVKQALRRCFHGLALALDEMRAVRVEIDFPRNLAEVQTFRDEISSDRDLARRVLSGESRWSAYLDMLNRKNSSETNNTDKTT